MSLSPCYEIYCLCFPLLLCAAVVQWSAQLRQCLAVCTAPLPSSCGLHAAIVWWLACLRCHPAVCMLLLSGGLYTSAIVLWSARCHRLAACMPLLLSGSLHSSTIVWQSACHQSLAVYCTLHPCINNAINTNDIKAGQHSILFHPPLSFPPSFDLSKFLSLCWYYFPHTTQCHPVIYPRPHCPHCYDSFPLSFYSINCSFSSSTHLERKR